MEIKDKIKLELDDSFYDEEERCDYIVSSKVKRVWAVELDLLNELINVCNKYDIKLSVYAGTLLGAVRHKGFIPWDDDIDVCLTRSEYEKLLKVAPIEFKEPYFFQTALTDKRYFFGYARLRNSYTTGHIYDHNAANYNQGIFIDIFVLDGYVHNPFLLKCQLAERFFATLLISSYKNEYRGNNKMLLLIRQLIGKILHNTYCKVISYEKTVSFFDKVLSQYNKRCERVSMLTHSMYFITRYWCFALDLNEVEYLPFETITVPVPKNYKEILTNTYGNYMEYPPVEKRGAWHNDMILFDPDHGYKDFFKYET